MDELAATWLDQVPDRIRICDRYAEVNSLPIPACLREQEQLESTMPVYEEVSRDELLGRLGEIAPLAVAADGPTWRERCDLSSINEMGNK